ncbi:UbiD family decarboxylase [Chloroflexota bacterium]
MVSYKDLREWIEQAREIGELETIPGADANIEIGTMSQVNARNEGPALLFDEIPGYENGFRVLTNVMVNMKTINLTFGLPLETDVRGAIENMGGKMEEWHGRAKEFPHKVVDSGPILENVEEGDRVNLTKFPVPLWHEKDGGKYIGTGTQVVTRDPDTGYINVGTYRSQLHDANKVGFYISPGKDGWLHRQEYFRRGKPCPVVMVFGADPLLYSISTRAIPRDICEYDYAGAIRGESIPVIQGKVTGLPIPANAEIAIEGFSYPGEVIPEGPYGEWTGYYAGGKRDEPFVKVSTLYHRNEPILLGEPNSKGTYNSPVRHLSIFQSALLKKAIETAGVPNVKGVWCPPFDGGCWLLTIVSIKQSYAGHAAQAGHAASSVKPGAYMGKYVIIVDDDINPYDIDDVLWALCTRSEPIEMDMIKRAWSGPLDPRIRRPVTNGFHNSRAIIYAVKPYEWKEEFPDISLEDEGTRRNVFNKWRSKLEGRWREY